MSKYNMLCGPSGVKYSIMDMPVAVLNKRDHAEVELELLDAWVEYAELSQSQIKGTMPMILAPWIGAN